MRYLVFTMLCMVVIILLFLDWTEAFKLTESIKAQKVNLYCNLSDHYEQIDVDKFVKYDQFTKEFIFTNGSAKNCYVE